MGIFPRGRTLSPKRNQAVTLKRQETGVSPRRRKFSSKEKTLSTGPEEDVGGKSGSSEKKEKSQKLSQEIRMDVSLVGHSPR